ASPGAQPPSPSAPGYHGVEPRPVPSRPEFVLTDTNGHRYDFQAETGGRPTFLYFGYTHCPDECPTAMADVAAALRKVSAQEGAKVRVVFVTTDPKRDTAPVLRRWLDQFSPGFVGLLGTAAQVARAQTAAGIPPAYPEGPVPTISGHPDEHVHKPGTAPHKHFGPLGYSVAHSAVIFAYDAADRLPVVYPGGVTPSDIAADLPVLTNP
ncbi:MAG: SCO family protein, partial [Mycobacteriales bacterium]